MRVKVEGTWYTALSITQEAQGVEGAYRADGVYAWSFAGYSVYIDTAESVLFNARMPFIEQVEGLPEGAFRTWLSTAQVYAGRHSIICVEPYDVE